MRSKLSFCGIILILLFFLAVSNAANAKTPQIVLPETQFEFPPVFEGQPVRHDFVIQNRGDAPLDIMAVRTD
jgi:hypothetical protein